MNFRGYISALASGLLATTLLGCSIFDTSTTPAGDYFGPRSVVISGNYDEIWRAVQKSLANYPIQVNNVDQGLIETEQIKGDQLWAPPFNQKPRYSNFKYALKVTVLKGTAGGEPSAQVSILKKVTVQKDFFSDEEKIPTDGLEEGSLLYRIEREVEIERSLKKAFERGKS